MHAQNRNDDLEGKLKKLSQKNVELSEKNRDLDSEIDGLVNKVQRQERRNWELSENIIEKTQELRNLNNETEYYQKMFEGEQHSSMILQGNIERVEGLIASRQSDLGQVEADSEEMSQQIEI